MRTNGRQGEDDRANTTGGNTPLFLVDEHTNGGAAMSGANNNNSGNNNSNNDNSNSTNNTNNSKANDNNSSDKSGPTSSSAIAVPQAGSTDSTTATPDVDMSNIYVAKHEFKAEQPRQLSFPKKAILRIVAKKENGWWSGELLQGVRGAVLASGWLPASYVRPYTAGATVVSLKRTGGSLGFGIAGGKVRE